MMMRRNRRHSEREWTPTPPGTASRYWTVLVEVGGTEALRVVWWIAVGLQVHVHAQEVAIRRTGYAHGVTRRAYWQQRPPQQRVRRRPAALAANRDALQKGCLAAEAARVETRTRQRSEHGH